MGRSEGNGGVVMVEGIFLGHTDNDRTSTFRNPDIRPYYVSGEPIEQMMPKRCRHCANHPSNGGSGVCNCTLGTQTVY